MESAKNYGQVRSIKHFKRIFSENVDDFIFEELDRTILFQKFGSWLSGYPVNCVDESTDKDNYDWWCSKLGYAYKRKIPLEEYPVIDDKLLFTFNMDNIVWCTKGGYSLCESPYECKGCQRYNKGQDYINVDISDDESDNEDESDNGKDESDDEDENKDGKEKDDQDEEKKNEENKNNEKEKDNTNKLTEYREDLSMKNREYFLNRIELLESLLLKHKI